jgi:hypothetical protein
MNRQEKELQDTIEKYADELKNGDEQFEVSQPSNCVHSFLVDILSYFGYAFADN